jgi:hypothetical protein
MTSLNIPSGKESENLPVVYRVEKSKVLMEDTWEKDLDLRLSQRSFQNPHVIYATTRVNSFTIFLLSLFYETIHKAFSHRNYGSKFVVLGYNSTYFSNKIQKGKTCYSEEQVISMLELYQWKKFCKSRIIDR